MAKKRKAGKPPTAAVDNSENGGRLGPITTYEDIADSEDDFHINRDKVLLSEGPEAKRRRKLQEDYQLLEPSDEEILRYSSESDEEADEDDRNHATDNLDAGESEDEVVKDDDDEDIGGWGDSRKDYYGNDQIETQEDAEMEEAELKRLQQKKLQKMSDADFGFDETEWLDDGAAEDEGDVVTELLKDIEIPPDMAPKDRMRILQTRHPEFDFLAQEFLELQPLLDTIQQEANSEAQLTKSGAESMSANTLKCRALAAYLASLTMYFAILTSPARSGDSHTLDPAELQDHPIMDSLLQCRELWFRVKDLKQVARLEAPSESGSQDDMPRNVLNDGAEAPGPNTKAPKKTIQEHILDQAAQKAALQRAEKIRLVEAELADLDTLLPRSRKPSKRTNTVTPIVLDNESDFGEEEVLDAQSAAEKALKKKSLRFYTSQIAQKSNKRAGAGRDAGGDMDVPYRERLRDRQARLNAEAEKRGKQLDKYGRGADLGGASDEEDEGAAKELRKGGDEYYDMVAQTSRKKKADKEERIKAMANAREAGKMVRFEEGEVGEDGKRAIGRVIEKNKGLAPTRKKDVRNPRVKKRKKFEEKKKKLASMKPVYKGGEERGGYGGEKTGIRSHLVKSVKL